MEKVGAAIFGECGRFLYGLHSLRRGGAQAMARAGWPVRLIQRWGRWLSDAIFDHLLGTEFSTKWESVAPSVAKLVKYAE